MFPERKSHCIFRHIREAQKSQVGFSRMDPIRLWLWAYTPNAGGIGLIGSAKLDAGIVRFD
jgi:hypothetical protein